MLRRRESSPTIRDVAQSLNLSHTTVSRVLNNKADNFISANTRERVMTAVREMNYRPNRAARALATGRTNLVALWVGDVSDPYYAAVTHHVEAQLRLQDLDMIHVASNRSQLQNDLNYFVDGILALDGVLEVVAFLDQATAPHPPLVSMGCYAYKKIDFVEVDLTVGAAEAVTHLLESGCKRVAYFVSEWGMETTDARRRAYDTVMQAWGREPEYIQITASRRVLARRAIQDYIKECGCPDGLFCFNDEIAIGAYRGLRDAGVRIPDDVVLVGCDGIEDTEYLDVPISTVPQPYEEMCARALALLKRRIEEPDAVIMGESLPTHVVVRASSRRT